MTGFNQGLLWVGGVLRVHVLGMEVGLQGVEDCGCDQGGADHNDV